ncbi:MULTISPECIES: 5'-nucleotidase C-terminal domain-containing protein [unclassified Microcystis]|uniref:5'-nucleotidase C-terminal domain-containing protein n=1 Tax=unclassified Microcystis TaxID=2643300 RepID=UPI0025874413|nr:MULTISPECIES: 5'-nucleotidase C-terminal domain-containing protein [unclassified Microcystis]MCA2763183.1 5'-nucleotidase C-terminal domain-containing protein [Microcystis sp. M151S2]MCA2643626.1 5'-nucleotidase C-terminal domain-containing protein [Microcystis sp. M087S2]MCA2670886.1 5'-nucleotidase C-terminal domain-containing protein [Microcystis sp. M080S2]MCA2689579.1 5'-nucleotidase C-terminal domain-containing protein [Microcystis sp. M037S2]MCA2736066.1 5'-nucleotidase C-terminal do
MITITDPTALELPLLGQDDIYNDLNIAETTFSETLPIRDIQGTGLVSDMTGTPVRDVAGIVTAITSNGFQLQDPDPDDNPRTWEDIFVFTNKRDLGVNGLNLSVGASVQVSVQERRLDVTNEEGGSEPALELLLLEQDDTEEYDDPYDTYNDQNIAQTTFYNQDTGKITSQTLRIRDIQGYGLVSEKERNLVSGVAGIVTGFATNANGFYLQDPDPDNDLRTSEGIFVFTGSRDLGVNGLNITVGASVRVSGQVQENRPNIKIDGKSVPDLTVLSTTQIAANRETNTIEVVSSGNPLPAPILIGSGGRVPPNQIIAGTNFSPDTFDIPLDLNTGIGFYESLEGMLVTVQDTMAVSPTIIRPTSSDSIWTVANQGADATGINSRGGIGIAPDDFNPERIQISATDLPRVDVGDLLGNLTGVVDYAFGDYRVLVTEPVQATSGGLQREVTNLIGTADKLTIASYNVENLNPTVSNPGGLERFGVLANQILNNLRAPDIIGLQEVQDNNGPIDDGTVAADLTYQALINAITAAGGPTYQFLNINPVNNRDGGAPGTNIRVGYLYNPSRVSFVQGSLRRITDPVATPDNDGAFTSSRKPLVATFTFNGQEVTVINNHLTSRRGGNSLFGNVQPPNIGSADVRTNQAKVLNSEVDAILADDPNANVVVLGDLNGFDFEEFQQILSGGVLTNLSQTLDVRDRATFNFQGNSQALDHVLVTNNLADDAQYDIVHVNVDFLDQPADHEPILATLNLPFTLQILQTSDQEAGIPAFRDIIGFSAVMNALDNRYANTLKLTTGDVYISSPFFNASRDIYDNKTGNPQAEQGGIADILINNELGWDVASVGNHEFSGGAGSFLNLVAPNLNWVNGQNGGVGIGAGGYPGAAFPYLANNLDYSKATLPNGLSVVANGGAPLPNTLTGSVVKDFNGEKVGIIGIVTPYLKSIADTGAIEVTTRDSNGNVITGTTSVDEQVDSIIRNITPEVQALSNAGINKIILMTHLQESRIEIALAQKMAALGLGVDLLLGGGSHQLMSSETGVPPLREDETQQNNGQLLQPFPQVYGSGDNKVVFVNSAPNYRYLNQLVVTFDYKGVVSTIGDDSGPYATDIAGVDRLYDESITTLDQVKAKADQDIVGIVDGVQDFVNQQDGNIFGQTDVFLNGVRGDVRTQETNLGNLTADAQDFYAEAYLNKHNLLSGFNKIDISFTNGGSIRDQIGQFAIEQITGDLITLPPQANPEVGKEEGDVSQLDISNSLRFDGDLVVGTVNATGFLQLAEHMISSVETGNGRFGQIGGFNFSYDPNAPTTQRIRSLALADATGNSIQTIVKNGKLVVASNTVFSVVTQGFLANGGDSYPTVIENIKRLTDFDQPDSLGKANLRPGRIQDAFAEYLSAFYNNNNGQQPFNQADTPQSEDRRIQSLGFRQDTVLDGITPLPTTINGTTGDDTFNAAARDGRQFIGNNQLLNTGSGNDNVNVRFAVGGNNIRTASGNDTVYAGTNNRIDTGVGNDELFLGSAGGNNIVTGGTGQDRFWITENDALLPANPNIIADYKANQGDLIGFFSTSLSFGSRGTNWDYRQAGANTIIKAFGQDIAILNGVNASTLTQANFIFS